MVRRAAVATALAAVTALAGAALAKATAPKQAMGMHLRSIDLGHRLILVEVDGFTKPPPANFFTMTDERGRHYIAQTIHCDAPFPSGTRACELEIPVGYERHPLVSLELHVRGLHSRVISVAPDEIKAAWAAGEQAHAPPSAPDGGAAPPDAAAAPAAAVPPAKPQP